MARSSYTFREPTGREILHSRGVVDDDGAEYEDAIALLHTSVRTLDTRLGALPGDTFPDELAELLAARALVPGTPLLSAARERSPQSALACTVVEGGAPDAWPAMRAALEQGAGVGIDLSPYASPVTALTDLNERLLALDGALRAERRRPVAAMATLGSRSPGLTEFIGLKRDADFGRWRFNLSVRLEGDRTEWDHLVPEITGAAHHCGEPGAIFWQRFLDDDPLPQNAPTSAAPCGEVALGAGEACTFAYVNLMSCLLDGRVDWSLLDHATATAVRMLDAALELAPDTVFGWSSYRTRRIGIGVMGFADLCVALRVRYGDERSVDLASRIAGRMAAAAYRASARLARDRGTFDGYDSSRYVDDEWFGRHVARFAGAAGRDDVSTTVAEVRAHGLRHSHLIAFPPTGNSSRVVGVSPSLEPRRGRVSDLTGEHAQQADPRLLAGAAACPASDVVDLDVPAREQVDVQAAFQRATLDAVSKTINVGPATSRDEIAELLRYADEAGCKGFTVFRDGCLDAVPAAGDR